MLNTARWFLFATLAIGVGLYPGIYFILDREFGLLNTKSEALLANALWNIGFYTHILFGGLALLVGWTQFSARIRRNYLHWHRRLGKLYVLSVMLSATAGIGIGFFATGGWVAAAGFIGLGLVWFGTTLSAYLNIRQLRLRQHEVMMTYSYAACFAAVTLRIWLPALVPVFGNFVAAYTLVAWLCWLPNLAVAYGILTWPSARSAQSHTRQDR